MNIHETRLNLLVILPGMCFFTQAGAGDLCYDIYFKPKSIFVITAFDLTRKPLIAYKRRSQKKRFPEGWDENKVKTVLLHYEKQTEDEAAKEDELAFKNRNLTVMEIPVQLVSKVRE